MSYVETLRCTANHCPKHEGGAYTLIEPCPDVGLVDQRYILIPIHPTSDYAWKGVTDNFRRPYFMVRCCECGAVTVHMYRRSVFGSDWWRVTPPTRWRKHVNFVLDGVPRIVSSVRLQRWRNAKFETDIKMPRLTDWQKHAGHFATLNILEKLVAAYVDGKSDFKSVWLSCLQETSQMLAVLAAWQREVAPLQLEAAKLLYENRHRMKSDAQRALRLRLAQTVCNAGLPVADELLVDKRNSRGSRRIQMETDHMSLIT